MNIKNIKEVTDYIFWNEEKKVNLEIKLQEEDVIISSICFQSKVNIRRALYWKTNSIDLKYLDVDKKIKEKILNNSINKALTTGDNDFYEFTMKSINANIILEDAIELSIKSLLNSDNEIITKWKELVNKNTKVYNKTEDIISNTIDDLKEYLKKQE